MSKATFSPEEIQAIKTLQEKYNALGIQLIQLKVSKYTLDNQLKALQDQESLLEAQIIATNNEERELANKLDARYGAGLLDLESGEFTPNS